MEIAFATTIEITPEITIETTIEITIEIIFAITIETTIGITIKIAIEIASGETAERQRGPGRGTQGGAKVFSLVCLSLSGPHLGHSGETARPGTRDAGRSEGFFASLP